MFTGIVEAVGEVTQVQERDASHDGGDGWSVTVGKAGAVLGDCHIGDSIAINGTCLTVTSFSTDEFKVNLAPETLRRTNLGELKVGSPVNLERATSAQTRFGGHFVQGHVDGTATIISMEVDGNTTRYRFRLDQAEFARYIVGKGYVTLDGTSLTVCDAAGSEFEVMVIPHTRDHTIMSTKAVGDKVNVEVDMLGKYADKAVMAALGDDPADPDSPLYKMVQRAVEAYLEKRNQ